MVSGGLYILVRGERILVDLRSVEESVVLALRSIGDIIDLGSVGKRSNLLVVCVGDVIDVGGVRVPVLFMKRVRLRRGLVHGSCRDESVRCMRNAFTNCLYLCVGVLREEYGGEVRVCSVVWFRVVGGRQNESFVVFLLLLVSMWFVWWCRSVWI